MPPARPFSFMPSVSTGSPKALRPTAPYFDDQTRPGLPPGPVAVNANCRGSTIASEVRWKPNSMVRP